MSRSESNLRHSPRLVVVTQLFHPENFRVNDMVTEWARRGYRVTVVTGIPNYPAGRFYDGYGYTRRRREMWNGVRVIRLPILPRGSHAIGILLNYISFVVSGFVWSHTTGVKADLVFTSEVSPMTQALVGVWFAKRRRVPHYLYVQDLWPENVEVVAGVHNPFIIGAINRMVDRIYRGSDRIYTTSPSFVHSVTDRQVPVPAEKVAYWPQYAEEFYRPLDRETVRREAEASSPVHRIPADGCFTLIFTGNIGRAQGLEILPRAAQILREKLRGEGVTAVHEQEGQEVLPTEGAGIPVRIVIVGEGRDEEAFAAEIRECGVEEMFLRIPRQPAEEIPKFLACADAAFVSFMDTPLFERTIPAKLQSYMACGMPILAAARGETARIIDEADCGFCVPMGDAEALSEAILKMKGLSATERSALGKRARAYFEAHFDRKLLMDQMDRWIREGIRGKGTLERVSFSDRI